MQQITIESIEQAIKIVDDFSDEEYLSTLQLLSDAQPNLTDFVSDSPNYYNNDDLDSYILYYILVIYKSFQIQNISCDIVTEERIVEQSENINKLLDSFFSTENIEILEEYIGQSNLIHFMLSELSTPDDDGTEIDLDTASQLFVTIIYFIFHLSSAIKS